MVVFDSISNQQQEEDQPTSLIAVVSPPWSMVAIKHHQNLSNDNNTTIIFPPANHENLHLCPIPPHILQIEDPINSSSNSDLGSDSDSNSSSTFSTWDSPLLSSPKTAPLTVRRFDSWAEILRSKLSYALRFLWGNFVFSRGVFPSFRWVVLVIGFLYFRQRRRLRTGEESRARLIGIINERDEKINQLLDQISRLNQVLLELQRVPSTA